MKQNRENRRFFEAQAFPHIEALYRTALYVSDSESDAQDLVQESFARAYQSRHEYSSSPNHRVWLFKIMESALGNRYRPSLNLSAVISDTDEIDRHSLSSRSVDPQTIDGPGRVSLSAISENDVKKAIGDLPDDFRLIVVLSLLEGFSCREIADIAGIDLEAVKFKLRQGRKLMQRELLDHLACESNSSLTADRVRRRRTG